MCIQTDLNESLNLLFVALVKQLTATDVLTNYWIIETVKDGYLLSRNLESTRLTFSSLHDVVRFFVYDL